MKNALRSMLVLLLFSLFLGQANAEELVLYDDFEPESGLIDPLKWIGEEGNEGRILRESVRKLTNKALKMKVVGYNNTDPNAVYGLGTSSLIHTNGEAVNDIKVTLKVNEFTVNRCSGVSYVKGLEFVRARLAAPLFIVDNENTTEVVEYIYVQFRVRGTPDDLDNLDVIAMVQRCLDANCNQSERLLEQSMGKVKKKKKLNLRIKWNKDDNIINFYRDESMVVFDYNKYHWNDDELTDTAWRKRIDVSIGVPSCPDQERNPTMIETIFDDVYVNESAASSQ